MRMASACLPFMFKAVEIDGEAYWDGGTIGNPALYPLVEDTTTRDPKKGTRGNIPQRGQSEYPIQIVISSGPFIFTLQSQHALGSERFRQAIEKQLARRTGPAKIGRPRKELANG